MNVLLISQCNKKALLETRRILDQFGERVGDRTWQTPITAQGLQTLRQMLKKNARRNTAVACHWIRGRDHTELLWIVGDASRFNAYGAVPTNTTARDILRRDDENDWHTGEVIRLLSGLAALFHDFGKASKTFQQKLAKQQAIADPYRHEWVSLRLFQAFVGDDSDDLPWLRRLAALRDQPLANQDWLKKLIKDAPADPASPQAPPNRPFKSLPPLARALGWLILSHHFLPTQSYQACTPAPEALKILCRSFSPAWNNAKPDLDAKLRNACWQFPHGLPTDSRHWCRHAANLAQQILNHPDLLQQDWLDNHYVAHLSRLALMLADHHYSSGPTLARYGDPGYPLHANTDPTTRTVKQRLDEHLIGVEVTSKRVVRSLPLLERQLPRIARHKKFKERNTDPRFRWQDKAFDLARSLETRSAQQGFFGINMASTGYGKTLANARILYGLADVQRGARFCIALGLRTLTLQTGQAYRERLKLEEDDLAVMVGGAAVKELFERAQTFQAKTTEESEAARAGSESIEALSDDSYVHYEGSLPDGPFKTWLEANPQIERLLSAPILVSTIDHLIPATEGTRGGRQIAPMLRLLSSDLVLDEPDDFDLGDLPALSRLVHWAGLLGSRVLLSSATLPPALVQGLFTAYLEGRRCFQVNRGVPNQPVAICCAWFDEHGATTSDHGDEQTLAAAHREFVEKRVKKLSQSEDIRRVARIERFSLSASKPQAIRAELAVHLQRMAHELHRDHVSTDPHSGKRVSFGLIRFANIDPLIDIGQALLKLGAETGHRIHLCCYHSRHLLLMRSAIERRLDRLLKRHDPEAVFSDPEMRQWLDQYPENDHLFIVLGSPVTEVGRDHDYDWSIVEPSSMRSIIQLAGRIRRHRKGACQKPNLYLLQWNIKALEKAEQAFCKPGFENADFRLASHDLANLLSAEQLAVIDARPRIQERETLDPEGNLADLEHRRLSALMLGDERYRTAQVPWWWTTQAALSGELQRTQRFRHDPEGRERYVYEPDVDDDRLRFKLLCPQAPPVSVDYLSRPLPVELGPRIDFWGTVSYIDELRQLAIEKNMSLQAAALRFGVIDLPKQREGNQGWMYHEALGFRRFKG
ncbi:type I-F CRISPR-associated helicase Cas3f [Chitinimonas lacunae]|uniref:Type I-F CRISPR-associated helicase Cas3f n=1 Tax=Chitinimonas lacunae TaxID=1963018 RepID=A0ABV8MR84_9NEIS